MAKELTWKSLAVASASQKYWVDLGIGPSEFSILAKCSPSFLKSGRKDESERVWALIRAGFTVKQLLVLAEDDSDKLNFIFALVKANLEITKERLARFEEIRWDLDYLLSPSQVVEWVELDLGSDELDTLKRLEVIDELNERGLETVTSLFSKIRWETSAETIEEILELIENTANRLGTAQLRQLVESGTFASVVSEIQSADEEAAESRRFVSGDFGDWTGLGISQYGMDFYMTHFFEYCDDAESLVDEIRLLLGIGYSLDELYSKVQNGFKFVQIKAMREAGLPISRETVSEWSGARDSKVILFFIDNGFTSTDRMDILSYWNLEIGLVTPWWDFCKGKGWVETHSRAQLLFGVDFDDISKVPQISTLSGDVAAELLDLDTYLEWGDAGNLFDKIAEIQRWRQHGFQLQDRSPYAKSYDDENLSMYDPLGWRHLRFSASEAVRWINALKGLGYEVSPSWASAWKRAGVSPESAPDWIRIGVIKPSEAAAWMRSGADAATAAVRKKAGISPPA